MNKWLLIPVLALGSLTACAGGGYRGSYYVRTAPPAPLVERYGPAPGPGHVWISGHYAWNGGRYSWVQGRWTRPPRPGRRWEAGRWEHQREGYRWREGRWR